MAISVPRPLLERQAELDELKSVIDGALARRGSVALVEGSAGIGKTRLLHETCEDGTDRGLRVLSARGSDGERQFPYGVARQLFERLFVATEDDGDASLFEGMAAYAAPVFGRGDIPTDRNIVGALRHG